MFWGRNEAQEAKIQQDHKGSIPSKPSFSPVTKDQGSIRSPQYSMSLANGEQCSVAREEDLLAELQSEDQGSIPSQPIFSKITDDQASIRTPQYSRSPANGDHGSIATNEVLRRNSDLRNRV
jgi:hypothetical protein